jgi:hypothetical protein
MSTHHHIEETRFPFWGVARMSVAAALATDHHATWVKVHHAAPARAPMGASVVAMTVDQLAALAMPFSRVDVSPIKATLPL